MKILYRLLTFILYTPEYVYILKTQKSIGYISMNISHHHYHCYSAMPPKGVMAWAQLLLMVLRAFWHLHLISNRMDFGAGGFKDNTGQRAPSVSVHL